MNQLTLDDFLGEFKELIHCQLSSGFHWLRITCGHTPFNHKGSIHFSLNGYDFLYVGTKVKDEILIVFDGPIKTITWEGGNEYVAENLQAAVG